MGAAPAGIFPEGGKTSWADKNDLFFRRAAGANENFSDFFRRSKLNFRVFDASAEGASEYFRVFSTGTAYDVIIFKFQEGGVHIDYCMLFIPVLADPKRL